jgi:hypothetical protein
VYALGVQVWIGHPVIFFQPRLLLGNIFTLDGYWSDVMRKLAGETWVVLLWIYLSCNLCNRPRRPWHGMNANIKQTGYAELHAVCALILQLQLTASSTAWHAQLMAATTSVCLGS